VKSGAAVDFGAIIRGLAVDRIADMLENSWGIHRALIMGGGGVVLALDPPGDAHGWRIGIGKDKEMNLCRFALASKSNERQATQFVDPRTGQCVTLPRPCGPWRPAPSRLQASPWPWRSSPPPKPRSSSAKAAVAAHGCLTAPP
jgi:hypothetical protein